MCAATDFSPLRLHYLAGIKNSSHNEGRAIGDTGEASNGSVIPLIRAQ
jgi:hypothetical protein